MTLPKSIKIGPRVLPVLALSPAAADREGIVGVFVPPAQRHQDLPPGIHLDMRLPPQELMIVFCHEVIHALFDGVGLPQHTKKAEDLTLRLEAPFYQLLRDNPGFIDAIYEA